MRSVHAGMDPPDIIEPGKIHRFPGIGKCNGNSAGWCMLFEDSLGGSFGDWSSGLNEVWQTKRDKPYSRSERTAYASNVEEARKRISEERQRQYSDAAKKAASIWESAPLVTDDHPYLAKKGVNPHGMRLHEGVLVIPIWSDGKLLSLQFIVPNGSKRFLSGGRIAGGHCCLGKTDNAEIVCITEGFATAASIREATGHPAIVAFSAMNLERVAKAIHQKYPKLPIVICADDDVNTDGNLGVTYANKAAQATGAKVAVPIFGDPRPEDVTDFNDMASLFGFDAVKQAIDAATEPAQTIGTDKDDWPDPLPLTSKIEPEPYPLDALPDTLRAAVEEVQAFVQAPVPLVASSALSVLSLAVQAHVDVKRAEHLIGPSSLFLLIIADSGERKSTCDRFFMDTISDYQSSQKEHAKPKIEEHKADMAAWEAKRCGIEGKIRQLSGKGESTQKQKAALRELQKDKPKPLRVPRLIYTDATPEELKWCLAKRWPSGGVISSEAGLVLGSHGMGKDSIMRYLATFNQLWDAMDIYTDRRTSESFVVRGARLTFGMQVQEAALRSFLERSVGLARGIGFLARFLIARPESTQGTRFFTEAPENWPALEKFNRRITKILEQAIPVDDDWGLTPNVLCFSARAKAAWVTFHDAIESELSSSGDLHEVRDVASKTADNAARMAALFEYFEHGCSTEISLEHFEGASRIAAWHLSEALRLYGGLPVTDDQVNVERLDDWLLDYCWKKNTGILSPRDVQQNITPIRLRKKAVLDGALKKLEERNRVRMVHNGNRKEIHINPDLLKRKTQ